MRRKALRRPLALLLAFVLCIGMLPAPALAQEADGESQPLADLDGVHDSWEQDSATVVTDDAVCEVTGEGKLHLKAGSGNWTGTNGKDAPPAMFVNHTASDALKAAGDGEKFLEMTITPISSKEHTRVGVYLNYTDPGNGFFIGFDATGWLYQLYNGGDGHFERSGVGAPEAGTDVTLRLEWTGTNLTKATANDQTIFENVDFSAANNSAEGVVAFKAGGETEAGIPSEVYLTGITYTGQQESPADETAPKLVSAEMTGLDTAVLKFDEALEKTSAETAGNYTFEAESGVTVTAAALAADGVTVTLTLEGLAAGATATLTISGVKDLAGNAAESITAELTGLEESDTSYLKENERIVPYDEWCTSGMDIPVVFAQGDNVASIKDGEVGLTQGSDYSVYVEEGLINLTPDFFKGKADRDEITLTVTFDKGAVDTYRIIRGEDLTRVNGWVMQKQGTSESVPIQEGWITVTEDSVVINHSKIIQDTGEQGWVIFNDGAEKYLNSILEYDITLSNPDSNQVGFINIAPATRVIDGSNYEGFAIDTPAALQRTGRKDGAEDYAGVSNLPNLTFEYGKTYHLRMVTEGSHITVYVTEPGGEEQMLTEFDSPIGLGESTYGFRIWRGGKTITIENIKRTELITSSLEENQKQIAPEDWGRFDVSVPVKLGAGDSIVSVSNGDAALETGKDCIVEDGTFTLKKEYIAAQADSFSLKISFAVGGTATLWIIKYDPSVLREYIWTPDQGLDSWVQMSGDGTFEMGEDKAGEVGLHVKGNNILVNTLSPMTANGEVELTLQLLSDELPWAGAGGESSGFGALFRADQAEGTYQAVDTISNINVEPEWYFCKDGSHNRIIWDGHHFESLESVKVYDELQDKDVVKDIKFKVRYYKDSITIWIDDQFCHTQSITNATEELGQMGLVLGRLGDILVKKAVFREIAPFEETESQAENISIANDGLTVQLDGEFPRVIDYTLNGKKMNGAELSYHYATVNNTDYPATAEITAQSDTSVTYHVTPDPERTGVTFDVQFNVLENQILEMLILNIYEPEDEMVFAIGLPQQPLISANSTQAGSALDVTWIDKNARRYKERNISIPEKTVSTTAAMGVTLPIVSNGELSASMFNNVMIGGDEFNYKGFELADGTVSVGVWNTEWMYRGMDNKKILPFPSEPDEENLYCRVVITEDTNGDNVINWQDGANALKEKLVGDQIPGGDQAARSFFHVGYNFSSGAQQPFLQVADNMKRLSNYMDGFSQQLIFKGYANEGHDSGHSDFQDVNRRAGGAEDMRIAVAEAEKINSNLGIHINEHEIYPEAKMFNDHTATGQNGWYWMDQSKILRRYVDMLDTSMENYFEQRMDALFEQVPIKFVYVDCWGEDRWGEKELIGTMLENGVEIFGNENAADFVRFGAWVHSVGCDSAIYQFVYNSQRDIFGNSPIYWGGYNRAASMMSWQHNNNINTLVEQFYTNQLPQKYLMCHEVLRVADGVGYFDDNITSSNYVITKDGNKLTDGQGKIFIPWYAEDSETKDPDEAAKIYHWNSDGGETTWTLPASWSDLATVYLYETTQTGKELVKEITVGEDNTVTIDAEAKTPYVVYPGKAEPDVTEWSVGSPLKDTMFNSRDFSIWQKSGDANIYYQDDGNGVSILYMEGTEAGQVSQVMTGLEPGQKYRVKVDAGAENGKTARITVTDGDQVYTNYLDQVIMTNQYFDDYAKGKMVQRMWVDFTATSDTATVTLSADECDNPEGKVTFMQTRIVKTDEPDLPKGYVAYETFEYVEQGAYGIFSPESSQDGAPHLSETHEPYTTDTINGNWSLKIVSARGYGTNVRTSPATMRLKPNTTYTMTFETLGNGTVYVQSESDSSDEVLKEGFQAGHNEFEFTTGDKTDYIVRIESGAQVLDDFIVYSITDETPPTVPTGLTATAVENSNAVKLSWTAAQDEDTGVASYNIYRDGSLLATVPGTATVYTDTATEDETEYTYQVSAVNAGSTEGGKSNEATVTTGVLPPAAVKAVLDGTDSVIVTFNKPMDKTTAETVANYQLSGVDGAAVTAASLADNGRTVTLTISGLSGGDTVSLKVMNVKDASGDLTVSGNDTFILSLLYHYFKFEEAEDADAVDSVGHANGAKNSVQVTEGQEGQAAQFTGSGYVDVDSDALYQQDTFTVAAWINWDGSSGVNSIVGNDISGDASSRGIIFHVAGDGELRCNSNAGGMGSGDTKVSANEWHHVAFVKQNGSAQLYLDGKLVADEALQYGVETRVPMRIGASHKGGGGVSYPFHGAIDEVMIYIAPLSADEIAAIYSGEAKPQTHTVTVVGGSGSGQYAEGAAVTVTAQAPEGQRFVGWSSADGVSFADESAVTTTFVMPDKDVTVTAAFEESTQPDSPNVASYPIKATAGEGGSISPRGSVWVPMGVNKTFTIKANEGYVIADVLVDGESVGAVSEYTFEKVSKKHTIEAQFKSAEGGETEEGFTDVPSGAWYAEAVKYVTEQGLMNGTSESTFAPLMNLSRSMMAQIFYNMEQRPETSGSNPFTDVADGQWYTDAVIWAAEQEIVNGYGGAFQPDGDITREQLAVMLYRYAEMKEQAQGEKGDLTAFVDGASVSDWAAEAMAWAVGQGILAGKSGNTLDPQGTATRAEVATILMRFCQNMEK